MSTLPVPADKPHDPAHLAGAVLMVHESDGSLGEVRLEPYTIDALVREGAARFIQALCNFPMFSTLDTMATSRAQRSENLERWADSIEVDALSEAKPAAHTVELGYLQWGDGDEDCTEVQRVTAELVNAGLIAVLRRSLV